ncbi:hypothetical protein AYO49_05170 [Verrucomicrobiaceae bacterium SCGC AG-212-N21]|nr:hypothetical protein AYO49_05170 [Verrucomicrobiaceae bacterium SCGC AG-212-N21]
MKKTPSSAAASKAAKRPSPQDGHWISKDDMSALQDRLREAQETLEAIRNGEVDAVVVNGSHGSHVYSLSGAEQPYRVYVEQMQEGAVTVSSEGVILYCNQRFAEMTGLPLERVISSSLLDRVSPVSWEKISAVLQEDVEVVKHEDQLLTGEGGQLAASFTASRLPLEDQSVICLVVTDLSLLREQEKLRLAKELAVKANDAKDVFLAALSHELRTPLTPALMAAADMESDKRLSEEVRETAGLIRRCISMETRLIDDLLDITRIARGKFELRSGAVDLHVALNRALEFCQNDISAKQLSLDLSLEAAEADTEGDMVRLQQAFWNVIRNAVKFTPASGRIAIRSRNTNNEQIEFEVSDSGIGFGPDASARLFAAFEQESESVTRRFGGLGLGLAISKSVVDAHGGSIAGSSDGEGKGATFIIRLPLHRPAPAIATPSVTLRSSSDSKSATRLRLLLVEDHSDTSQTMQVLLRRIGHEVTPADSAQSALKLASELSFDVVISDLGLPDMSGLAMMQLMRDRHGLKGIAVSGFGSDEDIAGSRAAGFIHHLTKPISFEKLAESLRDFS